MADAVEFILGVPVSELPNVTVITDPSTLPAPDPRTSEDCLFLDVIVPTPIFKGNKSAGGILPFTSFEFCFDSSEGNTNGLQLL